MKISYNWLKEYLDVSLPAKKTAEILTDIGLEVEHFNSTRNIKGDLEGLVVGEVLEVKKHPNADRLKVAKVSIGNGEDLQIICGAPNISDGQKVVVAKPGTTIYPLNNKEFTIKKATIRGVESFGMICAEDEIGIGESHEGIIVLNSDAGNGVPVSEYLLREPDDIFEIGLTPNRNDAMSHIGVARDLAAALKVNYDFQGKIKIPEIKQFNPDNNDLNIEVSLADPIGCPRYSGLTISGIKVESSPQWLKDKLNSIDIRPINNIVDVTNFVLHEFGQPLHAFDAEEIIGNKIIVKTLPEGTKFTTLDEEERKLSKDDLMICNENEGMCIAGVFGGIKSGVKETTSSIFLESAYFNPAYIRKTSAKHGIKSDAAMRFERGTDPDITIIALKRAALLIREIAGGKITSDVIDIYPKPIQKRKVSISFDRVEKLTGIKIPRDTLEDILKALEIEVVKVSNAGMELKVPAFKADVTREVDIIEEIIRIYGYNKIPLPESFKSVLTSEAHSDGEQFYNEISDYLSGNGFFEIMSTSITNSANYKTVFTSREDPQVSLLNYSAEGMDVLRPVMLFSGLETISFNINRQNQDLKLFEFGKTYRHEKTQIVEEFHLALFVTGLKHTENWTGEKSTVDFFYLKAFVNNILLSTGCKKFDVKELMDDCFRLGLEYTLGDLIIARFGELKQSVIKEMNISQPVLYADIYCDHLIEATSDKKIEFNSLPKFPSIRRDLALLVDHSIQYNQIENIALKTGSKLLKSINLFDIYKDPKLGKDKKSYAVSFIFQDNTKTLTDREVDLIVDKLAFNFKKQLNAEIRK